MRKFFVATVLVFLATVVAIQSVPVSAQADTSQKLCETCFKVAVNYGQSLKEMVADGKYEYANSDINADNFPPPVGGLVGQRNIIIELIHFGQDMKSEEVLKEFEARGVRAATLPELLAFGVAYPEKQAEFQIIALGSVWQNRNGRQYQYVPYLGMWRDKRRLDMGWFISRWSSSIFQFAAVHK